MKARGKYATTEQQARSHLLAQLFGRRVIGEGEEEVDEVAVILQSLFEKHAGDLHDLSFDMMIEIQTRGIVRRVEYGNGYTENIIQNKTYVVLEMLTTSMRRRHSAL